MCVDVCVVFFPFQLSSTQWTTRKVARKGKGESSKTRLRRHTVEQNDADVDLPPGPYADFLGRKSRWFQCSFLSRNCCPDVARAEMLSRGEGTETSKLPQTPFVATFRSKAERRSARNPFFRNPTQSDAGLSPLIQVARSRLISVCCG